METTNRHQQKIWDLFSVDLRSLGLYRIGLGFLIALDSFHKFFLASDFYSDFGVMPRAYWIENYMVPLKLSFHLASGDAWFQQILLAAQLVAALAFMVGWRTRAAGGVLLAFLCSLQSRNNLILSASDELMRLMLIWSFFVPVHARFAVNPLPGQGERVRSFGSAAVLLQLLSTYVFTAILKLHPVWTKDFSAVYFALNIDLFATPLGAWLRQFYQLTRILTAGTLAWEFIGPVTAILFNGWVRFACSVLFILFHLSLLLTMELGLFPWIAITYWLAFWPAELWRHPSGQRLEARIEGAFAVLTKRLPAARMPAALTPGQRRWREAFAAFLFLLVTWNNLASIQAVAIPAAARNAVRLLYVDQTWDMFAPYPMKNDGWFVIEGQFQDGEKRDLWSGGPISYAKPSLASAAYPSSEWRKFMLHVWDDGSARILLPFARYLCRRYSVARGQKSDVSLIQINFVKETTPEPGHPFADPVVVKLWSHDCFGH